MVCIFAARFAFDDGAETHDAPGLSVVVSIDDCRVDPALDVGRRDGLLPGSAGDADALLAALEFQAKREQVAVRQEVAQTGCADLFQVAPEVDAQLVKQLVTDIQLKTTAALLGVAPALARCSAHFLPQNFE